MSPSRTLTEAAVLGALPAPEKHGGPSAVYRASLAIVAGLTVLLPLFYIALVGAAAWGWWWWLQNGLDAVGGIHRESGSYRRGSVSLYVTPLIVGPLLVLFLMKPLLAKRGRGTDPWTLRPEDEPVLFALVYAVCDRQGAPRPGRIDLSMQVNASASFGRGVKAWFSNDLVLTLGMPLVACLDVRQLTSVLSHEFGHFSQTLGMRAYFIIATINQWFARVVYERDAWDERLKRWSHSAAWQVMAVLMVARAGVGLSRLILKGLMHTSHLLAQSLSRQMEFDADGYSVRMVGPDVFASSMETIVLADLAHTGAMHDLQESFKDSALPDNLVALVTANLDQIPDVHIKASLDAAMDSTASMYASHPPMGVRIAHTRSLGCTATMDIDEPAEALFMDWDGHSRQLTEQYYTAVLGDAFDSETLVPWEEVNEVGNASVERRKARLALFGTGFGFPLALRSGNGTGSSTAPEGREAGAAAQAEVSPLFEELWEVEDQVARGRAVLRLLRRKHPVSLPAWGFPGAKKEDLRGTISEAQDRVEELLDKLAPLSAQVAGRMELALSSARDLEGTAQKDAAAKLKSGLEAHHRLLQVIEPVVELNRRTMASNYLLRELDQEQQSKLGSTEEVEGAIVDQAPKVRAVLEKLKSMAAQAPAPRFKDTSEPVTLEKKLVPDALPPRRDINAILATADAAVATFVEDYEYSLGLIAEGVLAIEDTLELARIVPPATE